MQFNPRYTQISTSKFSAIFIMSWFMTYLIGSLIDHQTFNFHQFGP